MASNTVVDIISGGGSAANFQGVGSQIFDVILILGLIFFFLIILCLVVWAVVWYAAFKHRVIIFEKTAEGKRFKITRAKKIVVEGVTKYKFMFSKTKVQPPPGYDAKYFAGKYEALVLHKENDAFYFHVGYKCNENELEVLPQEGIDFVVNEIKNNLQRYGQITFWDKYGNVIINIAFVMFVFIFMLFLAKRLNAVGSAFTEAARVMSDALKHAYIGGVAPP